VVVSQITSSTLNSFLDSTVANDVTHAAIDIATQACHNKSFLFAYPVAYLTPSFYSPRAKYMKNNINVIFYVLK
jgi:hypothetical protein